MLGINHHHPNRQICNILNICKQQQNYLGNKSLYVCNKSHKKIFIRLYGTETQHIWNIKGNTCNNMKTTLQLEFNHLLYIYRIKVTWHSFVCSKLYTGLQHLQRTYATSHIPKLLTWHHQYLGAPSSLLRTCLRRICLIVAPVSQDPARIDLSIRTNPESAWFPMHGFGN